MYSEESVEIRHQRGMEIPFRQLTKISGKEWTLRTNNSVYKIILKQTEDCEKCDESAYCQTRDCFNLCPCLFSCSCPDSHPLCEHIHRVQSVRMGNIKGRLYRTRGRNRHTLENEVRNRHDRGTDIHDDNVSAVSDRVWMVKSEREEGTSYRVELIRKDTSGRCEVYCEQWECRYLCLCMYQCSCPDDERHFICKHVHKVHLLRKRNGVHNQYFGLESESSESAESSEAAESSESD